MPSNAFIGRTEPPSDAELSQVLGPTRALWDQLLESLSNQKLITGSDWHTYSVKAGWSLRAQQKKRNIVYLVPYDGVFQAAFVLGDKALIEVRAAKLPKAVMEVIDGAKKYAEGTGFRLEVKTAKDVEVMEKLAEIKARS